MNTARQHWPLLLAAAFALGGCVAVPVYDDDYGYRSYRGHGYYTEETIILSPPPRVEYRGYAPGYLWIDGYWSRIGTRQHWVPGYWAAPGGHVHPRAHRAPPRHQAEQGHQRHERDKRRDRFDDPERRHERLREPAHDRRSAIAPGRDRQALEPPRSARDAERRERHRDPPSAPVAAPARMATPLHTAPGTIRRRHGGGPAKMTDPMPRTLTDRPLPSGRNAPAADRLNLETAVVASKCPLTRPLRGLLRANGGASQWMRR